VAWWRVVVFLFAHAEASVFSVSLIVRLASAFGECVRRDDDRGAGDFVYARFVSRPFEAVRGNPPVGVSAPSVFAELDRVDGSSQRSRFCV